jgi:hypothetical protein
MSKRFNKIVKDVTERWKNTIMSEAPPDVEGATNLLKKVSNNVAVFHARTPLEFYIAQAVIRGRMAKKAGVECAKNLGINSDFIKPLRRVGAPLRLTFARPWHRNETTNLLCKSVQQLMNKAYADATTKQAVAARVAAAATADETDNLPRASAHVQLSDLNHLYNMLLPRPEYTHGDGVVPERIKTHDHMTWRLNFHSSQQHVSQSFMSLHEAVSEQPSDILRGLAHPRNHQYDAMQTEIICKALGCKDPAVIWSYEIFHYVPAFMQFSGAVLLLTEKPKFFVTEENSLHNETGPAVEWVDGKKLWYIDGHHLAQQGEKIVMSPEALTKDDINSIRNEEERRVAIDRMGWNRYLTAIGAKIADSKENWVDNTFEVLVDPPSSRPGWQSAEPLRMVLSCRSTGRKYFIAIPREVEHPKMPRGWVEPGERARKFPATKIKTCEDAQKWLANGATSEYLNYAQYPLNIVGAS